MDPHISLAEDEVSILVVVLVHNPVNDIFCLCLEKLMRIIYIHRFKASKGVG